MYRRARVTYLRPRSWWKKRGCMTNQYGSPREWFKVCKTRQAPCLNIKLLIFRLVRETASGIAPRP